MKQTVGIARICGVLSPFIAFSSILLAIWSYSEFNWINNALSDLGVVWGFTATIFNTGLIISGILFLIFAMGLFISISNKLGRIGATILSLSCLSLIAIGIFNESYRPIHFYVSVLFFTLMPISFFILIPAFWIGNKKRLSIITFLSAFGAALPWILQYTIASLPGVAIPEFISGLVGSVWTIIISLEFLKRKNPAR